MENLWPLGILSTDINKSDEPALALLEAQATGIFERTGGVINAKIIRDYSALGDSVSLVLFPASNPSQSLQLFVYRFNQRTFPASLEVFHLGEKMRINELNSIAELRKKLKQIFSEPGTHKIVRSIANLAIHDKKLDITNKNNRPIAIGRAFKENGKYFSQVNIFGVSGFLGESEIRELSSPKKSSGVVTKLNNDFVISLLFLGGVKMTVTGDELKILQSQAKKALSVD